MFSDTNDLVHIFTVNKIIYHWRPGIMSFVCNVHHILQLNFPVKKFNMVKKQTKFEITKCTFNWHDSSARSV